MQKYLALTLLTTLTLAAPGDTTIVDGEAYLNGYASHLPEAVQGVVGFLLGFGFFFYPAILTDDQGCLKALIVNLTDLYAGIWSIPTFDAEEFVDYIVPILLWLVYGYNIWNTVYQCGIQKNYGNWGATELPELFRGDFETRFEFSEYTIIDPLFTAIFIYDGVVAFLTKFYVWGGLVQCGSYYCLYLHLRKQ